MDASIRKDLRLDGRTASLSPIMALEK